jgi:hypothetical protein
MIVINGKLEDRLIGQYHPNKDIDSAIQEAVANGWNWTPSLKGHCKGRLKCNLGHREHMFSVYSTPKDTDYAAARIRRLTSRCPE